MAEGSFFEVNLAAFKKRNSDQAETIAQLAPKVADRLYPAEPLPGGYVNVVLYDSFSSSEPLFKTSDPEKEIASWIERSPLGKQQEHAVILLGFGLGYYAQKILSLLPERGVLAVVDPDPLLFFTAFQNVDLTRILGDGRVHLYIGQTMEKTVQSLGEELEYSRFLALPYHLLVNPLLRRLRPDYPAQFAALWRNALQRELMYRRSRAEHSNNVVINTIANADAIVQYPGVSALFHHFQRMPAALIAAGPSLENELATLHDAQEQMLIACVNTAYPILRKNGIRPHIVFAMDHQERNVKSFKNDAPSSETFLIADPRVHPDIIRHFHPRVFLASWRSTLETMGQPAPLGRIPIPQKSGNSFYLWLQTKAGNKGDVFGPGSVAVVGFHILARLGCQPIVLIGQDLAFTNDKRYAAGTIFDDKQLPQDSEAAHWVASVDGGSVPTSDTLLVYKQWLEHEIARFKIPVFNTSSGAAIDGAITTRLLSLLMDVKSGSMNYSQQLAMLHQSFHPQIDLIDLRSILREALQSVEAFYAEAKIGLNLMSPDDFADLKMDEKRRLLERLDHTIELCSKQHALAFELLNELLQEPHFEFDDSRWQNLLLQNDEEILTEKLRARSKALDAFVWQAGVMISLLEEKIGELER